MAGAGYKLYQTGDVLSAVDVNTYLQEQTVMRFASSAARTSALSLVLAEGMMSYLQDTDAVEVYNGTAWVGVANSGDITGVTAGTGISGGGTSGTVTVTNSMATAITTAGDLIKGTGSGTFDRLGIGSTSQILTVVAGAPAWATPAAAGSGLTFIARTPFSNQTAQNFDVFNSTYYNYLVILDTITAGTVTDDFQMRVRYGTTTATTASYYGATSAATIGSTTTVTGQTATAQQTIALNTGLGSGFIYFSTVGNTNEQPFYTGQFIDGQVCSSNTFAGSYLDASHTYTGFQLKTSSSNISGTVTIFGLAKA